MRGRITALADAWHCRPDVSEAERGGRVTQDVLADALLLGPRGPGRGRAVGEDGVGAGDHAGEVAEPGPRVAGPFVPAVGGVQERLVVGVGRLGDLLLKAHVAAHRVAVLAEQGAGEQAGDPSVAVLERVDDEKVEDEQAGQEHRMVLARRDRFLVALDQVIDGERGARGGHRLEADGCRAVRRAVHDEIVLCLEAPAGHYRVGKQQPVQVQDQSGVQRPPVLPEQIVLGIAIAGEFLLAAVAQRCRPAGR